MNRPSANLLPLILLAAFCFTLLSAFNIGADEGSFIEQFTSAQKAKNLPGIQKIIKNNKSIIPAEIEQMLSKANRDGTPDAERLHFLDLAHQVATMHKEWNNGDEKIIIKLKAILDKHWQNKVSQQEIIDNIKQVENVPGNFILNNNTEAMSNAGVAPVIYPHWVHRSFFRCKVCHESLVIMKRGANALSHEAFNSGKLCGACHDGKNAFDTTDEALCTQCHLFGLAQAEGLIDLSYYDDVKFTETAARLGGKWNSELLPDGKFPLSKLGFIDWVKLDELGVYEPLSSLGDDLTAEGIRESKILFTMPAKYSFMLDNVLWSHKIHTTWINCSICHEGNAQRERIFEKVVGAAKVSMIEIKEGKSCGTCHGRVSFPVADCHRCHNHRGEEVDSETIIRHPIKVAPVIIAPTKEKAQESDGFF